MAGYIGFRSVVSLNNVVATGAGSSVGNVEGGVPLTQHMQATIIVKGGPVATIAIQALMDDGTWQTIYSFDIGANPFEVQLFTPFIDMRLNVTSYTSGTIYGEIFVL